MNQTGEEIVKQLKGLLDSNSTDYRAILRLSSELSKLDKKYQRFFIDAKTLIHLGRDSIKDHTTALIELVKNSYDADSHNVDVQINCKDGADLIRIADNGFGMTSQELLTSWLRIGFSNKRLSKVSEMGRRKTGEKGIGRISADRLGANLELRSKTEGDGLVGLKVNWDEFDVEGRDVFDIDVEIIHPESINIPRFKGDESKTGTEIIITRLRQHWTPDNIEGLYNEFATLTPPFDNVEDFEINLSNDVAPEYSKPVNSKYYEISEIDVTVMFDGKDEIIYRIKDKYSTVDIIDTISLAQFYTKIERAGSPSFNCGPLTIRLLLFLRESSSVLGTDFSLSDLRAFLDNNYGVKIYRDNVAVKPYGFPKAQLGFDWLQLGEEKARNPAGIGRGLEYTVSPNQLVGAVFISRDNNTLLRDSAAREGLVENESFYDMKELVLATKRLLEAHRASIYDKIEKSRKEKQKIPTHQEAEEIRQKLTSVKQDLDNIKTEIEAGDEKLNPQIFLHPISQSISKVDDVAEEINVTISELLNWQRVLNGLATIGISSAVFGHETEGAITQFQGSTEVALKSIKLTPPLIGDAIDELQKAIKYSAKIASWGAYALTRVQKEKRKLKPVKIQKAIKAVITELAPAFEASSITLTFQGENVYSKTFQMDIETLLVNLLTNAYTAALSIGGNRRVEVKLGHEQINNKAGYYFSVADTGPGIAKQFEHKIFDPLYSTKKVGANQSKSVGTGLGLTIVKSIVQELEGKVSFSKDAVLNGANFKIWLPKIN